MSLFALSAHRKKRGSRPGCITSLRTTALAAQIFLVLYFAVIDPVARRRFAAKLLSPSDALRRADKRKSRCFFDHWPRRAEPPSPRAAACTRWRARCASRGTSRSALFCWPAGRIGLKGAPRVQLVLRLPGKRYALDFPLVDRGRLDANGSGGRCLRPVKLNQFCVAHQIIVRHT